MAHRLLSVETGFTTLRDWREAQRLSQAQAAEVFGISQGLWWKYETRRMFPRGKLAKRIADTTGIDLAVIIGAV